MVYELLSFWTMNLRVLINDRRLHEQLKKLLTGQELCSMKLVSDRNLATAILWFSTFIVPCVLPLKSIMRETTIYSRGGQRDDLRAPIFKCNYGISDAFIEPFFFYFPASFFCSSTIRGYFGQLWVFFLQKTFPNTVQCRSHAYANQENVIFTGNLCERHQWRAPAALLSPLHGPSILSFEYDGMFPDVKASPLTSTVTKIRMRQPHLHSTLCRSDFVFNKYRDFTFTSRLYKIFVLRIAWMAKAVGRLSK